jgi:hypothetical protein
MTLWLACVLTASPGTPEAVFEGLLAQMDRDGNGSLDAQEHALLDEQGDFSALDSDGSGGVSAVELGQWVRVTQPRPDARLTHRASPPAVPGQAGAGPRPIAAAGAVPPTRSRLQGLWLGLGLVAAGLAGAALLGRRRSRRRPRRRRRRR